MSADYVRLCLTCGQDNAPEVMRCACGALLSGIDLTARAALESSSSILPDTETSTAAERPCPWPATGTDQNASKAAEPRLCPHTDCGQPNPPEANRCLYCDRLLDNTETGLSGSPPGAPSLINLPGNLRQRFRIIRALPTVGAEAELLIVEALSGGPERVVKIYRHGIHPERSVQERIARIDPAHRVDVLESGLADGFTYELMEFCRIGSLRDLLSSHPPTLLRLREIIGELTAAISAVHAAGLIHRDLKPENVLVRHLEPLDLVLTDFSIASLQNTTLRFTSVARTLAYSAPETLSGVISNKADEWSLGMILLEAASGQHPFAGLSDPVILHHLTTRRIDLGTVDDPKLRKLLRGLLLRDPAKRWGESEISRWLADDPQLPSASDEEDTPTRQPYQIGDEQCFTTEQLAVGLARNWQKALSDLDNGLLLNWLRTELKDQNRVRFLIDLNMQRELHIDQRLLRLIIDLAPGIPPVWRGDSLSLRAILQQADRALKNDAAAIAWLQALHDHHVLAAYAAAGNTESADIEQRWQSALTQFNLAWQNAIEQIKTASKPGADEVTLYDDVVYGWGGPLRPSPQQLHAKLLALSYDPAWTQRLRDYLQKEVVRLRVHSPWLQLPDNINELAPAKLLALENLLPEARKQEKRQRERAQEAQVSTQNQLKQLQADSTQTIADIGQNGRLILFGDEVCRGLQEKIEHFYALTAQVRALGGSDAGYLNLRKQVTRVEPFISRIRRLTETLLERRAVNRGWLNQETLGFVGLAIFLLPIFSGERLVYPLLCAGILFLAWRLLPNYFTVREIKTLLQKIERH